MAGLSKVNTLQKLAARVYSLLVIFMKRADSNIVTEKNVILYLRSAAYGEFEAIVEEAFDTINPEIMDAVMDVSMTSENEDEITSIYWNTCDDLLKKFLKELYRTKISKLIEV